MSEAHPCMCYRDGGLELVAGCGVLSSKSICIDSSYSKIESNNTKKMGIYLFPPFFSPFLKKMFEFMFSKKATKIDEIFTVNFTLCSKCQSVKDFVNF